MLSTDQPRKLPIAFAADAGASFRRDVPDDSQIGVLDGAASFEDGFVPLNADPVASGGVPPSIKDMNGVLYAISAWARALSAGQVFPQYDSDFATAIGGYPAGAVLASASTPGVYYRCNANNNMTDPDSGGASNWPVFFPNSIPRATSAEVVAGTETGKYIDPVALAGASVHDFSANGYVQHPNGYIEQWGVDATARSAETSAAITFPIAFPNACLGISGTVRNTAASIVGCTNVQEVSISTAGAVIFLQSDTHPYGDAAGGFRWRAWGY